VRIVSAPSDLLFRLLTPAQIAGLPRYRGDLLLTQHSAGSLSSEAYVKQWNNRNEVLADAAERASVAASWLGAQPYARARLDRAWRLVLGAQFHDILAGTATPKAYEYSWNDQLIALNQFATVLTGAVRGVASGLDTRGSGSALVVYNPLSIEREDVVSADLPLTGPTPQGIRVVGPDGTEVPAQLDTAEGRVRVIFIARVPPVGFSVYDVQPRGSRRAAAPSAAVPHPSMDPSMLQVDRSGLENARYRVRIDQHGDVASIYDKQLHRELLAAPMRLALLSEHPEKYPAWNMDWDDQRRAPRAFVGGGAQVRVVEGGPARVALQIVRSAEGSRFSETIRLAAGEAGDRVEIVNAIDWRTPAAALKATFPLTASNPLATYNLGLGTIDRGNDDPKKYEVPAHQWFDLTDRSGDFGVTILSGGKYGSDKPDDHTLRLTLLYTPGARTFPDQATQDWGHHEFIYGLAAHAGDWRRQQTDWQAERLNSPLLVFRSAAHAGPLGKSLSLAQLSSSHVRIGALKQAEHGDELIVRLLEMSGSAEPHVTIRFAAPVQSVRELDAQERPLAAGGVGMAGRVGMADGGGGAGGAGALAASQPLTLQDGALVADFGPYQPRTFAVRLAPPPAPQRLSAPRSFPIPLQYELAVASRPGGHATGFDSSGAALPAELLPPEIEHQGIRFALGSSDGPNALPAHGQRIALPRCDCNQLYVLAASDDHDRNVDFRLGTERATLSVQQWSGYIGQWDRRIFRGGDPTDPGFDAHAAPVRVAHLRPGYIKGAAIGWFASHRHDPNGHDLPYSYAYLYAYAVPIPSGADELTLPDAPHVKVLALTAAADLPPVEPAALLYGAGLMAQ
jgi:alpha-mannosidase